MMQATHNGQRDDPTLAMMDTIRHTLLIALVRARGIEVHQGSQDRLSFDYRIRDSRWQVANVARGGTSRVLQCSFWRA